MLSERELLFWLDNTTGGSGVNEIEVCQKVIKSHLEANRKIKRLRNSVTSTQVSNELKRLDVHEPSSFFRDWTGAKENAVEQIKKGRKYYCVDEVNCYTLKELGQILIKYAKEVRRLSLLVSKKEKR
jgi:hypothetical protein